MAGTQFSFEVINSRQNYREIAARIGSNAVSLQRQSDGVTSASWPLSESHDLTDFLGAMEATFEDAEENGATLQELTGSVMPEGEEFITYEFERPLEVEDFESDLGIKPENIAFVGVGSSLGLYTYTRSGNLACIGFGNRASEIRAGAFFMTQLLPDAASIDVTEIREFIKCLPPPTDV